MPAGDCPAVQAAQSLDLAIRPFERGVPECAKRFSVEVEAVYRQSELVAHEHVVGPDEESRGICRRQQRQFGQARALGAQLEDSSALHAVRHDADEARVIRRNADQCGPDVSSVGLRREPAGRERLKIGRKRAHGAVVRVDEENSPLSVERQPVGKVQRPGLAVRRSIRLEDAPVLAQSQQSMVARVGDQQVLRVGHGKEMKGPEQSSAAGSGRIHSGTQRSARVDEMQEAGLAASDDHCAVRRGRERRDGRGDAKRPDRDAPERRAVAIEHVQFVIEQEPYATVGRLREHRGAVEIRNATARPVDRKNGSQRRDERDKENRFLAIGQFRSRHLGLAATRTLLETRGG